VGWPRGCQTQGVKAYGEWWYSPTHSYSGHAMETSGRKQPSAALWIGGRVGPRASLDGSQGRYNVLLLTGIELRVLGRPDHCLVTTQTEPHRPTILPVSFCNIQTNWTRRHSAVHRGASALLLSRSVQNLSCCCSLWRRAVCSNISQLKCCIGK
jgi:hypothetical protein